MMKLTQFRVAAARRGSRNVYNRQRRLLLAVSNVKRPLVNDHSTNHMAL